MRVPQRSGEPVLAEALGCSTDRFGQVEPRRAARQFTRAAA
ncbi:hypothetical protein [Salinispora arenicola]|nr:hypothetical protein [Salinispora arenicola]